MQASEKVAGASHVTLPRISNLEASHRRNKSSRSRSIASTQQIIPKPPRLEAKEPLKQDE
jgi:hypothetical protein